MNLKNFFSNLLWALASIVVFLLLLLLVDIILCFPWLNQVKADAKLSFLGNIFGALVGVFGVYGVTIYSFKKETNLKLNRDFAKRYVDIEREIKNAKHVSNLINKIKEFSDKAIEAAPKSFVSKEYGQLLYNFQTAKAPLLRELPEKFSFQLRQEYKRYSIAANGHLEALSTSLYSHYKILRRSEYSQKLLVDEYDVDWFKTNFSHIIQDEINELSSKEGGETLFEFYPIEIDGSFNAIRTTL